MNSLSPASLAATPGVVGAEPPAVTCISEFALAFEIKPFKVACFGFFKCQFFKVFPG